MSERTLLVARGDLPTLAAAAIQPVWPSLVLWCPPDPHEAASRREERVRRLGRSLGASEVIVDAGAAVEPAMDPILSRLERTTALLRAVTAARSLGATRIVVSDHLGHDLDALLVATDRLALVAELLRGTGLRIESPIIDLEDRHLVDLIDDAGLPLDAFWPCQSVSRLPCSQCRGCRRWSSAFEMAGVSWPWAGAPAAMPIRLGAAAI